MPVGAITLTGAQAAAVVGASIGLAIAVIVLLTRSTRALNGFTDVLKSYAEIITGLNNELTASYEQRRELREQNDALVAQVDALSIRLQKAEHSLENHEQRVVALQHDKGQLKDTIADLKVQAERDTASHGKVVTALTEKIDRLTRDVAHEKQAREQTEHNLQAQIRELTERNKALEHENRRLTQALSEAITDKTCMQEELAELRTLIEGLQSRQDAPAGEKEE